MGPGAISPSVGAVPTHTHARTRPSSRPPLHINSIFVQSHSKKGKKSLKTVRPREINRFQFCEWRPREDTMILLSCLLLQAITALEFRIPDGTKRDSYIGNLPQNANLKSSSDLRQFVIVTGSELIKVRDFYRINQNRGQDKPIINYSH